MVAGKTNSIEVATEHKVASTFDAAPKALIVREKHLKPLTNTSRKFRDDAMKAGTFPRPLPLGPKARGWLLSEIEEWIEQRKAARDAG